MSGLTSVVSTRIPLTIKLGMKGMRRSFLVQIGSWLAIGLIVAIGASIASFHEWILPVMDHLKSETLVTAYMKPEVADQDQNRLAASLRTEIESKDSRVDRVNLTTPQQFLERLKSDHPDLANELFNLGPEMPKIVPRIVTFYGVISQLALDTLRGNPNVDRVETSEHELKPLLSSLVSLQRALRILGIGLLCALVITLTQLATMNVAVQADIIQVLSQWGAGVFRSRLPVIITGFSALAMGSLFGIAAWLGLSTVINGFLEQAAPIGFSAAAGWAPQAIALPRLHALITIGVFVVLGATAVLSLSFRTARSSGGRS